LNTPPHKQALFFSSNNLQCEAYLFTPVDSGGNLAIDVKATIILGQGFGCLWQFGCNTAIQSYVNAGYAVFAFNYRGFGESEGEPRQFINPHMQVEDWLAAIEFIKARDDLPGAIVLWGSSFSGGHVLTAAAACDGITAVLAQVPHCDSRSAFKHVGLKKSLSGLSHGLFGGLAALFGHEHSIAIVAEPGERAAGLSYAGWKQAYLGMVDSSCRWENKIPARCVLTGSDYNPIDTVERIGCPVYIAYGEYDQGILVSDVEATIKRIPNCQAWKFEGDHFDVYDGGKVNVENIQRQLTFLGDCS